MNLALRFFVFAIIFLNLSYADYLFIGNEGEGSNQEISVLDTTTFLPVSGSPLSLMDDPIDLVTRPDGSRVYTIVDDGTVAVSNGSPPVAFIAGSPFALGGMDPRESVINSAGTLLYTLVNGGIVVQDAETLDPIMGSPFTLMDITDPQAIAINASGTFLYIYDQATISVGKYDAITLTQIGMLSPIGDQMSSARALVVSPDEAFVYVAIDNGDIAVFDANLTPVGPLHPTGQLFAADMTISPDGSKLYIVNSFDNSVSVIETVTFTHVGMSPVSSGGTPPLAIVLNAEGTLAYVINNVTQNVGVIDAVNPALLSAHSAGGSGNPVTVGLISVFVPPPPPPPINPPTTLTGSQTKNDFGCQYELFNTLRWSASPTPGATGYNIYRDGLKIATVDGATLEYEDHNRRRGAVTTYGVTALLGDEESSPISVIVL